MLDSSFFGPGTVFGRIARYPLKWIPTKSIMPILRGPLRGKKWIVGSQRHAFWLGLYEPELQQRLSNALKPGDVFYDIGANVGFYSLLASTLVGAGKVISIEPSPGNIEYLKLHLDLNRCTNVEILQLAVCDRDGYGSFALDPSGSMGRLESTGELQVRMARLDELLRAHEIPAPNCIKMDIEGAEYLALLGSQYCFRKHKPVLFLATHGQEIHNQCCELLLSWDYEMEVIRKQSGDRAELIARASLR